MKGKAFLDHSHHHAIFIFLSKMVGKNKIFKNMHGDEQFRRAYTLKDKISVVLSYARRRKPIGLVLT